MATFVSILKFTDQGICGISETTKRASALKTAAKRLEIKIKAIYWTLADYDGLLVFDAPDDETATALMLYLGSLGNLHSNTARAFTAAEMDAVLAKVATAS